MTSGLVLALATLLGSGRWTVVATVPRTDHLTALLASAVVGFIEEGIFRGVLQTQLVAWLGRWRGLLLGAALFGLWHIPQRLLAGLRGTDLVASLVPVLVVGIVLGLFMLVVRNTVGPALLHTGLDWIERL